MNIVIENKRNELEKAKDFECWYLVKHSTDFCNLCYLVSFLISFIDYSKDKNFNKSLEKFIEEQAQLLSIKTPDVNITSNYRTLRVAAYFGLIKMNSNNYQDATISATYREIELRCNGKFEKIELYDDIICRQIEKMFISSEIDEESNSVRMNFRLYPIMLLYKVLIELARSTGDSRISILEYRYFVATTKTFNDFLDTLLLIKLVREEDSISQFEKFKDKFDNRMNKAIGLLNTLNVTREYIEIKTDKLDEVAKKVFCFESNPNLFIADNYLSFLCSTKSLFDLERENDDIESLSNEKNKIDEYNVFGIHITRRNNAMSVENPHVCIGWSGLGDLSAISTKQELRDKYRSIWSEHSANRVGSNVGQIWMFKDEMKTGDFIVFFDGEIAHIGKVISDYYFDNSILNQDADYVNNKKVEWIKDIAYKDLPSEYRKSALTQKSMFRLNSYKPLIADILNEKEIQKDEFDDYNEEKLANVLPIYDFAKSTIDEGINLIVYGTPGCGKSYYVEKVLLKDYPKENYIRTTFYQDYTNTDFVGQILPVLNGKDVSYKFNPGPFTLALEQAIRKPNENIALVIEELNRGSAASIFGDIFQLLDRKKGLSEYSILNVNIIDHLNERFDKEYEFKEIRIPGNLSIFATMNTSDQNVFTLDTAFKRRWKFKKLINKFDVSHKFKDYYVPGADITWKEMVETINDYILEVSNGLNGEDKQLGVYFVDESGMRKEVTDPTDPEKRKEFAYKVLEYLWADVAKFDHKKWFGDIRSLDELIEKYETKGLEVFSNDIFNK